MAAAGRWFRPPRHVLTLFLGVTGALSLAMAWLAWQLIAQDRALASQRTQERLDNAADVAVAALRHGLETFSQRLEALSKLTPDAAQADLERQTPSLGDDAVLMLAGEGAFEAWPAGRLVYYPASVLQRPLPGATSEAFAAGEALEFQRRDLPGALRAFDPLTRSANARLRAGAWLRSARILAQLDQSGRALGAYDELAALGATPVEGLPAELLARYGRCLLLRDLGRHENLGREAAMLARGLNEGRWQLTRAEYEFYRVQALRWLPAAGPDQKVAADRREWLSAAVAATWDALGMNAASTTPAIGVRQVHVDGAAALAAWHGVAGSVTVLVAGPRFVDAHLAGPANADLARYRARVVLADADGSAPGSDRPAGGERLVRRTAAETRLPWSIRVVDTDPGAELKAASVRSRLVVAGLLALGLFVLAGSAFIIRAVNRELEVSRLQTDFVAAVSHEFRSPLTSIRQASEVLLEGRVPETRREEYYRLQQRESERLQRLVESLLDFGRMESGAREYRFEPVDVTALLEGLVGEFSAEAAVAGYTVEAALKTDGLVVSADCEALSRAVWNLLDNAVKYSSSHKTVWLRAAARDGRVEISVEDRGVGVAAEDQQRIFDKFARGANAAASGAKGTGLGLAMVRHIVTAHGGQVRVASAPGAGSTFTITLPAVRSEPHRP